MTSLRDPSDGDIKPAASPTKLTTSTNPIMDSLAEKYSKLISTDAEAEALKFLLAHPANQPKPQSAEKPEEEVIMDHSKQIEEAYQLHADLYGDASAAALIRQNNRKASGISEPDGLSQLHADLYGDAPATQLLKQNKRKASEISEPDRKQSKFGPSPIGQPYASFPSFPATNGLCPSFGPSTYCHDKERQPEDLEDRWANRTFPVDMIDGRELMRLELQRQEMESLMRLELHRREVEATRLAAQIELKRRAYFERRRSMMEEEVQRAERERLVAASILSNLTGVTSSEGRCGSLGNDRE